MTVNKDLLYDFLLKNNVIELNMESFQSWFNWFVDKDLINIEVDEQNNISKALFIRKLYDEDVENFPLYSNINMGNIEKTLKFYIHRPDGNVYYLDLLVDQKRNYNNYIFDNYKFMFIYLKNKFNFEYNNIKENEKVIYFKSGRKTVIHLCEHKKIILQMINGGN